jgi:hypothetical protein
MQNEMKIRWWERLGLISVPAVFTVLVVLDVIRRAA